MADTEKKRVVRSKEERKAEIDKKIAYHKECITALEAKKAAIDSPKTRNGRGKGLKRIMNESKLSDEEMAKALGMPLEEVKEKIQKAAAKK